MKIAEKYTLTKKKDDCINTTQPKDTNNIRKFRNIIEDFDQKWLPVKFHKKSLIFVS